MSFRKKLPNPQSTNSAENLISRQKFVIKLLEVLESGFIVMNCDESSFNQLFNNRRAWFFKDEPANVDMVNRIPNASLNAAITSEGSVFYSMHNQNKNYVTTLCFFHHLHEHML